MYRKTYDDLLFNAFEVLNFPTGMTYVEISELPNYYLLELLDDFKPRLLELQKMREAKQVESMFGGGGNR
jgi:hypothetical protein